MRCLVLRNNALLTGYDGRVVQIIAAQEPTYRIACDTPRELLRCAFHLGNRHTQTQVGEGFLRIYQDSVLKEMLEGLGATVMEESAQFELEAGAYTGDGGHHHHDDVGHSHSNGPLAPIPGRQKILLPAARKS